jgi:hypothetical protein
MSNAQEKYCFLAKETYGVQAHCKSFQGRKRLSFLVMRELQIDSIYKGREPAIAALIAIA